MLSHCSFSGTSTLKPAGSIKAKMNSSVVNYIQPFNHSSSGSSLQLSNTNSGCISTLGELLFEFIFSIINLVVGYPANIMVMWLVARKKSDSNTSDIFIFNLAIADAFYCLMPSIGFVGLQTLEIRSIRDFISFSYGIKDTTPLFLTCICLDRYVAVVHPIVFTSIKDNKIRVAISMLVWGIMLAYAICRTLWLQVTLKSFSGLILAVFAIMVFCNISIMWSLRKSVFGKEKMHPMKQKALRTVQITLAIIVFNYLPIVSFSNTIHFHFPEVCQIEVIAFALMDISASIEPLIYISKMDQLPCLNNLPCICCRSPSTEPHNVST